MLIEPHRKKLLECGLTTETWGRARLHSGSPDEVKEILGYGGAGSGLVIPYDDSYARVRIDNPGPDGKRYRSPVGQGNRLYVPPSLAVDVLTDAAKPLYLTEGEFKALKATQEGFPCVALPGVWSWKTRLHGKSLPISDLDTVVWKGRRVIIVFDSDLADKPMVSWAEHALVQELRRRDAQVYLLRLPSGPKGEKYGLDDYLVAHGVEAFKNLPMQTPAEADKELPTFRRMSDLQDEYLARLRRPHHRVSLGYPDLDAVVRGIAPGEVMTILGRTGVGKTAFGLNLIERMTHDGALPTLIFSLEMQGPEVFERVAAMGLGMSGRELEALAGSEDPQVAERLLDVGRRWHHVVTIDKPCSLDAIDNLIRQAQERVLWAEPLRLVVIDYLGLIGFRKPGGSTYEQVSIIARELKNIAKRNNVALLVLCQVDREGGSGGEVITLRMGRDSGAIEEASDYLLGIWRPGLAENTANQDDWRVDEDRKPVVVDKRALLCRVLKNRSGPAMKTVTLHLDVMTLRITATVPVASGRDRHAG